MTERCSAIEIAQQAEAATLPSNERAGKAATNEFNNDRDEELVDRSHDALLAEGIEHRLLRSLSGPP
jgi:hypothetical protein